QDSADFDELYSAPLAGGESTKISLPLEEGGTVAVGVSFTPDSGRVVYRALVSGDSGGEFYSVPVTGGDSAQLSGPMVEGGGVAPLRPTITDDGAYLVYLADQDTAGVDEL